MSEVLLGIALREVPRDQYTLCSKLGRYDVGHFDFSAKRVAESVDVSLHRLGTDHLDIILCHDIEFTPLQQIIEETLPALRRIQQARKFAGVGQAAEIVAALAEPVGGQIQQFALGIQYCELIEIEIETSRIE